MSNQPKTTNGNGNGNGRNANARHKVQFDEVGVVDLSSDRAIVVSTTSDGNVSIANRVDAQYDGGKSMRIFLKNAILLNEESFKQFFAIMYNIAIKRGLMEEVDEPAEENS